MILVWGARRSSAPGQRHKIVQARKLIKHLEEEEVKMYVSAVTVAEVCAKDDGVGLAVLDHGFEHSIRVLDFDYRCATKAAQIQRTAWDELKIHRDGSRQSLKDDIKIIATAILHRVDLIYSEDRQMKRIGSILQPEPMRIVGLDLDGGEIEMFDKERSRDTRADEAAPVDRNADADLRPSHRRHEMDPAPARCL